MIFSAAVLAFVIAQPATHQPAPRTDETVPVQRGTRLMINNFAGEVVIRTWDKDSLHVVARHHERTRVNIRPGGNTVSISASGTRGPQGSVDYEITAPVWMPIKVEGTYAFVSMDGVGGEVSAETVNGDVIVKGGTGVITAKSIQGQVLVDGARGKINVSTTNEKVAISNSSGEITADSINGDVTLTGMDAKSVDASTVNGNIVYEGKLQEGGHYTFGTHNGDIALGLPENVNATFTFRTYQGGFSSDLPLQISRNDLQRGRRVTTTLGNGSADVSLETFGGSIRLRKGSVGRPRGRQEAASRRPVGRPEGAATAR